MVQKGIQRLSYFVDRVHIRNLLRNLLRSLSERRESRVGVFVFAKACGSDGEKNPYSS
jgi:hypothetical protein